MADPATMSLNAAVHIQTVARRRLAKKAAAARKVLQVKRDELVQQLSPLYEELYVLPAAKDEEQHVKLLHRLIVKNTCGANGEDSLTEVRHAPLSTSDGCCRPPVFLRRPPDKKRPG
jgi:hypothetical protein